MNIVNIVRTLFVVYLIFYLGGAAAFFLNLFRHAHARGSTAGAAIKKQMNQMCEIAIRSFCECQLNSNMRMTNGFVSGFWQAAKHHFGVANAWILHDVEKR